MAYNEGNDQLETTGMAVAPYMRINRDADLVLTSSWQRLVFNGTSTRNANTFPLVPMSSPTKRLVTWDSTNSVIQFNNTKDKHYDLIFNYHVLSQSLLGLTNLTPTTVQLQFVVPSGTPRTFPLPDDGGYVDIAYTSFVADVRGTYNYILRSVTDVQAAGIGINIRLQGNVLGVVTLKTGDLSIYGR